MSRPTHSKVHMVHPIGWLRAAVPGANDGRNGFVNSHTDGLIQLATTPGKQVQFMEKTAKKILWLANNAKVSISAQSSHRR